MEEFMYHYGMWILSHWFSYVCFGLVIIAHSTTSKSVQYLCESVVWLWAVYGLFITDWNM